MADWAGAAGAGAAAASLEQMLAQKFLERKQAEIERAQRAQEAQQAAEMAQRAEMARENQRMQLINLSADRDERYQDRTQRVGETNTRLQRETLQDQIRAKERTEDAGFKTADREDEQKDRAEQLRSRQSFEALMARRAGGGGASTSEPLVAIKDPVTGQPTLVPRSQAAGKSPASTRDQALTEGQGKAAAFADRMKFNEQFIKPFETTATSRGTQVAGWVMPNEARSDEFQAYEAAKKNWIAALMRRESGAVIGPNEYKDGDQQYFPQPGEGPKLIEQKRKLRAVAEAAMRRESGSAGAMSTPDAVPQGNDLGAEW
jgi:hypothetical protein